MVCQVLFVGCLNKDNYYLFFMVWVSRDSDTIYLKDFCPLLPFFKIFIKRLISKSQILLAFVFFL